MKAQQSISSVQAVFDEGWYLSAHPDVAAAGLDPWDHYCRIGMALGRPPNRFFDGEFYRRSNPDVDFSNVTPIDHYITVGWREGRNPSPLFEAKGFFSRRLGAQNLGTESVASLCSGQKASSMDSQTALGGIDVRIDAIGQNHRGGAALCMAAPQFPPLVIVVCHYRHPELARRMLESMVQIRDELIKCSAELFIVNDSPDDRELDCVLKSYASELGSVALRIVNNKENLGFVKSSNLGMRYAIGKRADILLLNSDALLYPGTLEELRSVAYTDPMIGFVSPRSNNATICTLQLVSKTAAEGIRDFYAAFVSVKARFPRFTFVPTVVGFCLYAKGLLLSDIGVFDEAYGMGYNEENDLVMRANRMGYRAVLANHCAAWHDGESSFGATPVARIQRDRDNANILNARYPEYTPLVQRYFQSPEFRAESIFVEAFRCPREPIKIAFDLSNVGAYHNGTFEAAKRIISAADLMWPDSVSISCYVGDASRDFHGLKDSRRLKFLELEKLAPGAHAIVRVGQPFTAADVKRLFENAPVVAVFMLDTISWDCGYLAQGFNEGVWRFVFQWADFIFTNSDFTRSQILNRFPVGPLTSVVPLLHSTVSQEYLSPAGQSIREAPVSLRPGFILIVGNKFHHKNTDAAASQLSSAFPHLHFVALGSDLKGPRNVTSIDSGGLSDHSINWLYEECSFVIFPSHYEGFGFPVLHALARKKPIFVRSSPLYSELAMHVVGGFSNIHEFDSMHALQRSLSQGLPVWRDGGIAPIGVSWADSAARILECVASSIEKTRIPEAAEKLRWLDYLKSFN
jgi:GT2 family glycosyltransferase